MPTIRLNYTHVDTSKEYGCVSSVNALPKSTFMRYGVELLDLGDIAAEAKVTNALAAIFDLEGFTNFCSQIDPQLVIPEYMARFIPWLFDAVKNEFTERVEEERVRIWGSLPFFGKFTGDGVLFLWNTDLSKGHTGIGNIVNSLWHVCRRYETEFYPTESQQFSKTPPTLRVGIARGHVFSIGDGKDYVGPCINMAARLQKLASLSFALSKRGIDLDKCFSDKNRETLILKKINIRGVGEEEVVILNKEEYEKLDAKEKAIFQ